MQSILEIDGRTDDFTCLLRELAKSPVIDDRDLEALDRAFYRRGGVDRQCAAEIFHANRIMRDRHHGWMEFYLEALTDFFLEYHEDGFFLPDGAGAILLAWLGEGTPVADIGERRLILRLLLKADDVPERFERRVLDALSENLLEHSERWLGNGSREAGVIDVLDMQLLRKSVYGAGRKAPNRISSVAADFLADLDRRALSFMEPGAWRSLLIDALALHLRARIQPGDMTVLAMKDEVQTCLKAWFGTDNSADEAANLHHDVLKAAAR